MSTACGRRQGGGVSGSSGQGEGVKNLFFCGRHKWMAPIPPLYHLRTNLEPIQYGCRTFPPDNSPHILCKHTYTFIHTYTHVHTHMHTHIYTYIHIHAYIYIHTYTDIHTYTYVCMYASKLCMYVCMYTYNKYAKICKYISLCIS